MSPTVSSRTAAAPIPRGVCEAPANAAERPIPEREAAVDA